LGGVMVFENKIIYLKKINPKCVFEECSLEDLTYSIFI
jgi:hypothetical protein